MVQRDAFGGEYRLEDDKTLVALWLPLTLEQKEAQITKALAEGTSVSALVTSLLHDWLIGCARTELELRAVHQKPVQRPEKREAEKPYT